MEGIGKYVFAVFSMMLLLGVNFASAQAASSTGVVAQDNAGVRAVSGAVQGASGTNAQVARAPAGLDFATMEADDYVLEQGDGTYVYIYVYDTDGSSSTPQEGTNVKISVRDSCDRGAICTDVVRASPVGKAEYDAQHGRYVAKFSTKTPDKYMLYATITKGADEIIAGPRYITVNVPLQEQGAANGAVPGAAGGSVGAANGEVGAAGGAVKATVPREAGLTQQAVAPKQAQSPVQQSCPQLMPPSPKMQDDCKVAGGQLVTTKTDAGCVSGYVCKKIVNGGNAQPPKEAEKPISAKATAEQLKPQAEGQAANAQVVQKPQAEEGHVANASAMQQKADESVVPVAINESTSNKELLATIERLISELLTLRMQLLASS